MGQVDSDLKSRSYCRWGISYILRKHGIYVYACACSSRAMYVSTRMEWYHGIVCTPKHVLTKGMYHHDLLLLFFNLPSHHRSYTRSHCGLLSLRPLPILPSVLSGQSFSGHSVLLPHRSLFSCTTGYASRLLWPPYNPSCSSMYPFWYSGP
jgi:hypothetical protein